MKKIILLFLIFMLPVCGCAKKTETQAEPTATAEVSIEPTPEPISNTRPIAVMIDNDNKSSRPHAGIDEAYLLYEMYVEGSATRIMALFKDTNTAKIGPVRSSRHYFLDYVLENDAIYVHFGWSPQAANDINKLKINKINGVLGGDGGIFWRERKYAGDWHSAYTSVEKIMDYSNNTKKYRNTTEVRGFNKLPEDKSYPDAEPLSSVLIPYAPFYSVSYKYDEQKKEYVRYINGEIHKTQNGTALCAKNLIIQKAKNYTLSGDSSGRQNIELTGSGEGFFISNGEKLPITWTKSGRSEKTVYYLADKTELSLNPGGQTWIQIVPPSMSLTME